MTTSAPPTSARRQLRVWDIATRVFHWSLFLLLLACWFSGGEGDLANIHRASGMMLAGLIVFRIVWGFAGGEHARFGAFFPSPGKLIAHLRQVAAGKPERHLGHNPVGAVAVFLLLIAVSVCILTGLFSSGEGLAGPFAEVIGFEMSDLHELAFRVLQGLVALHLLGVVAESLLAKDALVPAMITGRKSRAEGEPGTDARQAGLPALLVALLLGGVVSAGLWSLPSPAALDGDHREGYDDHDRDRDREDH
ncbi:cytochrome b/b6 domain-containing protein [Hyphomonas sp.]|uniref:cytochrome b/b6 domain-containing protein n=1 Tax=Hyphomonas sp. TaxID=87 RepID=UPI0025BA27BB|nr:cytochrome b/b6 domain-containing protein [Hyphomonas sp.]